MWVNLFFSISLSYLFLFLICMFLSLHSFLLAYLLWLLLPNPPFNPLFPVFLSFFFSLHWAFSQLILASAFFMVARLLRLMKENYILLKRVAWMCFLHGASRSLNIFITYGLFTLKVISVTFIFKCSLSLYNAF